MQRRQTAHFKVHEERVEEGPEGWKVLECEGILHGRGVDALNLLQGTQEKNLKFRGGTSARLLYY